MVHDSSMVGEASSNARCSPKASYDESAADVIATKQQKIRCWQVPHGPSGHSCLTKMRFASSLFSLFHVFSVVGLAKDIFVEKFGCDVTTMGTLFMVVSFWTPFSQFIHGNLQDRQYLARFFPIERWGRRAPWLLTHVVIGGLAASAMYIPPTQSKNFLYVWFIVVAFLADWGMSSSLIAFETARVEIYPFKEERILVEGICKYACMLGGGSGGLAMMVLLVNGAFSYRFGVSFFVLGMSLLSLWAVPVLKEAKAKSDSRALGGVMSVFAEALPWKSNANRAMQHLMAVKIWNGAYGASVATAILYYITYVLQLSGWSRNIVIAGAALAAGLTEVICNSIYMWLFGTGDSRADKTGKTDRSLLRFVVLMRVMNAFVTCIMIGYATPSVPLLFVWSVTARIGLCGFTFWKISAQCWLVDEDCHFGSEPGRRREGIIFGALNMVQNFSAAFLSSAVFIGLGLAGLTTRNCNAECEGTGQVLGDCVNNCFSEVISSQPDSLRLFVRIVIGFWAPFCELMVAFHAWHFPIKGARLRKLNNVLRESRGEDVAADDEIAVIHSGGRGRVDQIAAHQGASKMAVNLGHHDKCCETEVAELAHVIAFAQARPAPKSVAVFFEWSDGVLAIDQQPPSAKIDEAQLSDSALVSPPESELDNEVIEVTV